MEIDERVESLVDEAVERLEWLLQRQATRRQRGRLRGAKIGRYLGPWGRRVALHITCSRRLIPVLRAIAQGKGLSVSRWIENQILAEVVRMDDEAKAEIGRLLESDPKT